MSTENLIRLLAADAPARRPVAGLTLATLIPALALGAALLIATLGLREDLAQSFTVPVSVLRFALTAAAGLIGLRLALTLARPEGQARLWPLAAVGAMALGALLWAFVATPPDGRQMAVVGKTMVTCLVTIPLLSILPVTAILAGLRRGATTAPARAGFAAGIAGSGLSAMIYALHCTEDSPLFYVTWYGLAMAGVTLAATLIGSRLLRW